MSRYIDADAFDERVRIAVGFSEEDVSEDFKDGVSTTLLLLKTQPTVDAVPRDELIKLAKKVSDMREAQKRYFKGRSLNDLTVSKQLEAEVDAEVKAILDPDLTLF